jgi:hypothetical protein
VFRHIPQRPDKVGINVEKEKIQAKATIAATLRRV